MPEEITPVRTYVLTGLATIVLAAITIGSALIDLHGFNVLVNVGIAALTVGLIVAVFMRVHLSSPLVHLAALAGLLWFGILLVGTLGDYFTRGWLPVPGK